MNTISEDSDFSSLLGNKFSYKNNKFQMVTHLINSQHKQILNQTYNSQENLDSNSESSTSSLLYKNNGSAQYHKLANSYLFSDIFQSPTKFNSLILFQQSENNSQSNSTYCSQQLNASLQKIYQFLNVDQQIYDSQTLNEIQCILFNSKFLNDFYDNILSYFSINQEIVPFFNQQVLQNMISQNINEQQNSYNEKYYSIVIQEKSLHIFNIINDLIFQTKQKQIKAFIILTLDYIISPLTFIFYLIFNVNLFVFFLFFCFFYKNNIFIFQLKKKIVFCQKEPIGLCKSEKEQFENRQNLISQNIIQLLNDFIDLRNGDFLQTNILSLFLLKMLKQSTEFKNTNEILQKIKVKYTEYEIKKKKSSINSNPINIPKMNIVIFDARPLLIYSAELITNVLCIMDAKWFIGLNLSVLLRSKCQDRLKDTYLQNIQVDLIIWCIGLLLQFCQRKTSK
ncbi:hypothetical protein IMG5_020390 [Ichthyophthirius multifiliis]|uniref:Uncharacterized protein n=1 Tax=Ichthyophthirius multifiliis TaxID=5932 RepID=G0QKN9_ICHMU|nr:hypothetical protein IMG5_020390 [Ichthyophthirius multifiliis]EGR34214.1 hypothetical protein IMG5_020390 [Ichthyophthirius multifiliis]|eukprot:XP_004039518.1 hypothetical protein IMG5_020390 [Ichthyophthirius multifiliis]